MFIVLTATASPVDGASRTVRVGVYQNKPKIFMDENGHASGFLIELLEAIAAKEEWTLVYAPCEWSECLVALEEGRIDLMPDVAYSAERAQKYDFHHTPVAESWSQVYANHRVQVNGFNDLNGRRVAVLKDSIQQTVFGQYMRGFGFEVTLVPTGSLEEAFNLASNGSADAAIANDFFGDYFSQAYGLVNTPIVFNAAKLFYATAQGRNADLLEAIDRHLDAWLQEPNSVYYTTLRRWTEEVRTPAFRVPEYFYWGIGAIGGLLLVAVGMILLLRAQVRARTRHLEQTTEALRESETRYRLISTVASDYMFSTRLDADGKLVLNWVAGAFEAITGYTFEEYVARGGWRAALHPDDLAVDDRDIAKLRANQPVITEIRTLTKSGRTVWVRVYAQPVLDAERKELIGIYGAVQDITERKSAEQVLRENEQRLASIYNTVGDVIYHLAVEPGEQYRFSSVNPAFCRVTGLPSSAIVGKRANEIIPEPSLSTALGKYRQAIAEKTIVRWEETSDYPAGQLTGEVSVAPVFDEAGNCTSLVGSVHDITERKRTEIELRRNADEFAALYEIACDLAAQRDLPVLLQTIVNHAARLIAASDVIIRLYDPAREELELVAALEGMHHLGMRFKASEGASGQVLQTRRPLIVNNYQIWEHRRPDLPSVDVRAVAQVPMIYGGEIIGVLGIAEIGTERKFTEAEVHLLELLAAQAAVAIYNARLLDQVQRANVELEQRVAERTAQLQAANKALESFSYSVSHDLRAPLRAVSGFAEIIARRHRANLNEEGKHYVDNIVQASARMGQLIDDLLQYSRLGRAGVHRDPIALRDVFAPLASDLAARLKEIGGTLTLPADLPSVTGDRTLLIQIFSNLLENAVTYRTPDTPAQINVSWQAEDKSVIIRVSDNGIGIPPEHHEKIFNVFQRLHSEEEYPGTGIGLATVKKSVELLGGSVWVESEVGKGSTFLVRLPKG